VELDIIRPAKKNAIAEMRVVEIEWEKQTAYLASLRDITQRKQAEAELEQAKKAAEAANRAKSEFLANMSHELRTPLNVILGYAQMLQSDDFNLTAFQSKRLSMIERSGEHLLTLINDILDLSRIEAGRIELYPSPFHLPCFLQNIVDMFSLRASQKRLLFHYQPLTLLPA
ncbi:MAG: histidine kinase dimerization/phospho-acceptor domain-containing protein, partial [Ardenticatenaceae bacterium]